MKTIVEVGANWGGDTKRFADESNNFVYAFEPTPELFDHLCETFSSYSNVKILPFAVDEEEGEAIFNIAGTGDWGCSSLYTFDPEIHQKWEGRPDFHFTNQVTVEKKRLDNFINENNIDSIDYLWVDAQGNDFKVMKSLGDKINIVKEGKCEGSYSVDLYVNTENNVSDIVQWLTSKGFKCKIVPDNVGKEADVHFRRA
jgi:FkbM family methyltransferase